MKSFEDWCNQKNSLPPETQKSINYLLEAAGTSSCSLADAALKQRTEILTSSPTPSDISDLRPFSSLTNLRKLSLFSHKITDLTPIANLQNLETLVIHSNSLTDLTPISKLNNLTDLGLIGRNITDIRPLSTLTQLQKFTLWYSSIQNIEALQNLTQLMEVSFITTQISVVLQSC